MMTHIYILKVRFLEDGVAGVFGNFDCPVEFEYAFPMHPTKKDALAAIDAQIKEFYDERVKATAAGHMNKLFQQAHAVVSCHRGDWWEIGITGSRPSLCFRGYIQLVKQTLFDNNVAIG